MTRRTRSADAQADARSYEVDGGRKEEPMRRAVDRGCLAGYGGQAWSGTVLMGSRGIYGMLADNAMSRGTADSLMGTGPRQN